MNKEIEEQKEGPVPAPIAGESEPAAEDQHTNQHIDELKKLKLVQGVKFGLSVGRAARIAKLASPSAHLVLRSYKQSKRAKLDEYNVSKTTLEQDPEKDLLDRAKLDCMLEVIQAREKGEITKTNVLGMDRKVNKSIRKILEKDNPKYELTLLDKIKNGKHHLPKPNGYKV